MEGRKGRAPRLPPRWFIRSFWQAHRAVYRLSGGRIGLWRARERRWGTLRLTTTGRRTGRPHRVIIGYIEDGGRPVTLAMNGWDAAEPAWWLNLRANPDAQIVLPGSRTPVPVRARAARDEERERLWRRWAAIDRGLDGYASLRPGETAVVVFEPGRGSPAGT